MAISNAPWDGSASRFDSTEAYCAACLIDENDDTPKVQAKCHLPVKEPSGALNRNGVHAAAAALAGARGGVGASPASKKKAASKLRGYYAQLQEPVPDSIKNM